MVNLVFLVISAIFISGLLGFYIKITYTPINITLMWLVIILTMLTLAAIFFILSMIKIPEKHNSIQE